MYRQSTTHEAKLLTSATGFPDRPDSPFRSAFAPSPLPERRGTYRALHFSFWRIRSDFVLLTMDGAADSQNSPTPKKRKREVARNRRMSKAAPPIQPTSFTEASLGLRVELPRTERRLTNGHTHSLSPEGSSAPPASTPTLTFVTSLVTPAQVHDQNEGIDLPQFTLPKARSQIEAMPMSQDTAVNYTRARFILWWPTYEKKAEHLFSAREAAGESAQEILDTLPIETLDIFRIDLHSEEDGKAMFDGEDEVYMILRQIAVHYYHFRRIETTINQLKHLILDEKLLHENLWAECWDRIRTTHVAAVKRKLDDALGADKNKL